MTRCPICGGDAWDSHAACMQEEPPRCNRTAPKDIFHGQDTISGPENQDGPLDRAWKEFDAS